MTENLFTPNSIRTISGRYVNLIDPNPETIIAEDIAHSLAMQCRWVGHVPYHYSVAQHSVACMRQAPPHLKLTVLLHDASEAYLSDIARPGKINMPKYKELEGKIMEVIAGKFGIIYPFPQEIHEIDDAMLRHEWECMVTLKEPLICCWSNVVAEYEFLNEFNTIYTL
jgi:hypothetical protein